MFVLILAEAYRKAQEIRGEADAEAARIFAEVASKDPEFYKFIRALEAYKKTLDGKTLIIIGSDSEFLKYLIQP